MSAGALASPGSSRDTPAGSHERRRSRLTWLVAGAVALAALSLLLPWSLAFDPWAWVVWGRELTRGTLGTEGAPAWKPLPVAATTVFAAAGAAAPALWLVVARAGGLLALAGAHRLAGQLAGAAVAWTAVAAMALSEWWVFNTALGNSEGLLVAAVLWAVVAHRAGRRRAALALGVAAALLRPEAWPFLLLYSAWLARSGGERPAIAAAAVALVPLLWFVPDALSGRAALGAAVTARGTGGPDSPVHAAVPALEVLREFAVLATPPVLALAAAGALLGGALPRRLAAAALVWVGIVAVMTQAGYAGNPRYNVVPAAVCCVLAGLGAASLGRRATRNGCSVAPADGAAPLAGAAPVAGATAPAAVAGAALAAGVLFFTTGTLGDQLRELGERAQRRQDLGALVDRAGGAAAIRACGRARTVQAMKTMLAWRLDVPIARLIRPPRPPTAVFRAPAGYAGQPPGPAPPPGAARVAAAGDWVLYAACAPGRALEPVSPRGPTTPPALETAVRRAGARSGS